RAPRLARPGHCDRFGAPACRCDVCALSRVRVRLRTQTARGKGSDRAGGRVGADVSTGLCRPGGSACALADLGPAFHACADGLRRRALPGAPGEPVSARRPLALPPDRLELAPGGEELRLRLPDRVLLRARFGQDLDTTDLG